MIDPELLQIFREETNERVDRIEATLLAVESGEGGDDAIDSLFRDAHSIKGNAGMVGFEDAQRIAHAMEDVLESARDTGALPADLGAALLEANDAIRRAVDGDSAAAAEALAKLSAAGNGAGGEHTPPAADAPAPEPALSEPAPAPGPEPARTPSTSTRRSLRVAADKVDRLVDVVGETVLHRRRLDHIVSGEARRRDRALDDELSAGDLLLDELQDAVVRMRTLPLSSITAPFPRAVRDIASSQGKDVRLELIGAETQLDRLILDGISEAIVHLLRNSISHGVEAPDERVAAGKPAQARVELRAEPRGDLVEVCVSDDGRGVSAELLERARERGSLTDVLAEAGMSTAAAVTELSGRGVGLDAVKRHVESLGGSLEAESEPGRGTRMRMLLPLTLAMLHLMLVERQGHVLGIPVSSVVEVVSIESELSLGGRRSIDVRGETVPLVDLARALGDPRAGGPARYGLVVASSERRVAALCDRMLGEQEAMVKSLGPLLAGVEGYLGATILPDERVALIVDPSFVAREGTAGHAPAVPAAPAVAEPPEAPTVLVVDDQFMVRELQRSILESAGYRVETASHGREALDTLSRQPGIDLVVTDIEMPEMDGLELVRSIRAREDGGSLPVVVVSSRASDDDRRKGADAGADAYIVKGEFSQGALLDTVGRLVTTP